MLLLFFQSASAVSATVRYSLGGIPLPRPADFTRDQLFIKHDYLTLSGKTARDITSRKERFGLTWAMLKKVEVEGLLSLIEQNEPLEFYVSDGSLIIQPTTVIPQIKNIVYDTPGETYLAQVKIELTEVT